MEGNNFLDELDFTELERAVEEPTEQEDKETQEKGSEETEERSLNNNETSSPQDKEEETEETSSAESTPSDDSNISLFQTLASALKEEGVSLTQEEMENIKSAKDLVETLKKAVTASEYDGLTEAQRKYLDAIRVGVPEEEVKAALKIEDVLTNKITPEVVASDPAIQEGILYQYYKMKGVEDDAIQELVETKKKTGNMEVVASQAYEVLREKAKNLLSEKAKEKQKELEAKKKEEEEKLSKLKEEILKSEEIIPGIKVPSKAREKIFEVMTTPVKEENGVPINAIDALRKEKGHEVEKVLAYLYVQTDGFTKLENIKAPIKSSAIDELDKMIKSGEHFKPGSPKKIVSKDVKELLDNLDDLVE